MFPSKYHLKFQSNTIFAYVTKYLLNNNTTHIPVSVSKTFVKCVIYSHPLFMLFSQPNVSCVTKNCLQQIYIYHDKYNIP